MSIKALCGAILTLMLSNSVSAAPINQHDDHNTVITPLNSVARVEASFYEGRQEAKYTIAENTNLKNAENSLRQENTDININAKSEVYANAVIPLNSDTKTLENPESQKNQPSDFENQIIQSDMSGSLKYSVWILIGLGPLMWIWLASFPTQKKK